MPVGALDGAGVDAGNKAALGVFEALPISEVQTLLNLLLCLLRMFGGGLRLGEVVW